MLTESDLMGLDLYTSNTNLYSFKSHHMYRPIPVGVVVQLLDYSFVTKEPGVQFPTGEKVPSSI